MSNTPVITPIDIVTLVISILALLISGFTAWLTYFNRGKVYMTTPSMIVFAYDYRQQYTKFEPKIMIRSLIFSTGERGQVIEALYARLRYHTTEELFPVWGVNADNQLVRGGDFG